MADLARLGQPTSGRVPDGRQVRLHRERGREPETPPSKSQWGGRRDSANTGSCPATRFSPDGKRLAINHALGDSPHDIWVYDLKARTLKQITDSLVGGLHRENFVNPQLVV